MFRQYITLVRLPNIFTAVSNILPGYCIIVTAISFSFTNANLLYLAGLMVTSSLLYMTGIVLNDYFDIEIDKKERPTRPLPSGNVSKRKALIIAISSTIAANVISLAISWMSFVFALILTAIIIAYDSRLKHKTITGPITMSLARFVNVILGASPAFPMLLLSRESITMLLFIATTLFIYILSISILSKKEVSGKVTRLNIIFSFAIVFVVITSISIAGLIGIFQTVVFVNLALFSAVMIITLISILRGHASLGPVYIQNSIRNMIISIIILDSAFVSGIIGLQYGLATLLLTIPSILLARKLYTT
ncbi:MAG TPA: UbiA family prenyltransferase [Nitrososphaeraceae archaeon]|nr:UbiA family prenyltransferase [Nitrososphaeraceae archaeon]